jgi:Domain of unknown function (DUF1996)
MRSVSTAILALLVVIGGTAVPAGAGDVPEFIVRCPFSHRARNDPIVFPGDPGAAHLHDFFGNRSTNASSTYRSLRRGRTTCELPADKAAYWIPTLYARDRATAPNLIKVYYTTRLGQRSAIRPFPKGLRIIAGNPHAHRPQSLSVVHWDCGRGGPSGNHAHPVDCGAGYVHASIIFPDCWNGVRLDSRNHRRHMAYSIDPDDDRRYRCTRSHPVPVPRIKVVLQWPVHDGTTVRLSNGPAQRLHGDFIDAWDRRPLRRLIGRCLVRAERCGTVGSSR